jgi:hypothetical protein
MAYLLCLDQYRQKSAGLANFPRAFADDCMIRIEGHHVLGCIAVGVDTKTKTCNQQY